MREAVAVMLAVFAVSCSPDTSGVRRQCLPTPRDGARRAAFVLTCAKNANPKSDEEPEDMLSMCSKIADRNYCEVVWAVRDTSPGPERWIACEHASPSDQKSCAAAGWGW